ncbi:MAG: hypothetical protein V3S41_02565 [Spirochaetia bacterium]
MFGRIALGISLIVISVGVCAQPAPNPSLQEAPESFHEAPESLLELDLGDAEVALFLSGGWTTGIGGALGLSAHRNADGTIETQFPSPFPGLDTVPFFNRVDLTLSLRLLDRYFFETTVSDQFQLSSLLFGYSGLPNEFVQSVLIGNAAIEMGAYSYLGFGDSTGTAGREAPGIAALFQTDRSSHELMVRLEPSEETVIRYSGGRIISESSVNSADYIRDRFFVLPDGGLGTLTIYAESTGGSLGGNDGRNYRLVDLAAETEFSLAEGTLSFAQAPVGRIVAYYESGGLGVGDGTLGRDSFFLLTGSHPDLARPADFSFAEPAELLSVYDIDVVWSALSPNEKTALEVDYFRVLVDGRDGLLLYEPGRYSPFEVAGLYDPPVAITDGTTIEFATPHGTALDLPLIATETLNGTLVSVSTAGTPARSYDRRYPFAASLLDDPAPEIYGPAPVAAASRAILRFHTGTGVDAILLDSNYVPGSVRVVRNGTPTTAFEVSDSGELIFVQPLSATDTAVVQYRTAAGGESGDLLLGIGNRFNPYPGLEADIALGMRWKPIQSRYSTTAGQYPGYIALSASAGYAGAGAFTVQASAGASYSVPDSTGVLRVNGMNGSATTVFMSARNIFPAAPPTDDPDPADSVAIDATKRGTLFHRDFTSAGFLGSRELQNYLWTPPPLQIFDYADGGRIGPYAAVSNDTEAGDYAGNVMVMEYDIAVNRTWVAGLTRINGGRETDLSGTTRIEGSYRVADGGTGVRAFIQIGALSEDIDADGVIDVGSSTIDPYLSFNDPATGWTLAAGAVNQQLDSPYTEDADRDNRSDPELPDVLLTRELPPVGAGGWQTFQIDLTRAEQRLLRSSRSVRYLIQRDVPGGERTGRFVFSDLRFYGAGFTITAPTSAEVSAREIPETSAGTTTLSGAGTLAAAFPAVAGRLGDAEAIPSVLAVEWSGLGTESFTLSHAFSPVAAADYQELRLYARGVGATDAVVTLRALTEVAEAVVAEWSGTVSGGWIELIVGLPETSAAVIHSVEVEISGQDAGEILLDELSFWTPRETVGATGSLEMEWGPEVSLDIGGRTVVDGIRIRQSLRAQSAGYADGLSATRTGVEATTDLAVRVIGAPIEIGIAGSYGPNGPGLQASHALTIPIAPARTSLTEFFRRSYLTYGESLQHHVGLAVGPIGPADGGLDWQLDSYSDKTVSSWNARAGWRGARDGAERVAAGLGITATEATVRELQSDTYPADWLRSFVGLAPTGEETADRTLTLEAELKLSGSATGLTLGAALGTAVTGDTDSLATTLAVEIAAPVTLGDRLRVTPSAGRAVTLHSRADHAPSFSADVSAAAAVLGMQTYLIAAWPVWELWDPRTATAFAGATTTFDTAQYLPSVAVEISRPIRSSPWSLVVPTNARVSASRELSRREDAVSEIRSVTTEISLTAPNVLGRLGSSPTFDFYDTDELITSAAATVRTEESGRTSVEIDVDQIARLFWLSGESLTINTAVAATGSGAEIRASIEGEFLWTRPAAVLSRFDRTAPLATDGASFDHTESIEVVGTWSNTASQIVTVKHATRLTLSDRGSVSLYGGFGIGSTQQEDTGIFFTGLQLGIGGKLQF